MPITVRLFSSIVLIVITIIGCSEKDDSIKNDSILGQWISLDKSDTLNFVDKTSFYKSNVNMRYDHFDYLLNNDSIKIGYSGIRYILVQPTKHKYSLNGNALSIDFSNKNCYGFDLKMMNYLRK